VSVVARIAEALSALEHLHRTVGEVRWLDGLRHHRARSRADTLDPTFPEWMRESGLGKLRLAASSHSLEPVQVSWANSLHGMLVARLDRLAEAADSDTRTEPEWERPSTEPPLPGWSCLVCGNTEVGAADAEEWIARSLVPFHVGDRALLEFRLLTEDVLQRRLIGTDGARSDLVDRARLSGVQITDRLSAMTVCTVCGSGDTQSCSWVVAGGGLHRVDPHAGPRPDPGGRTPITLDEFERLADSQGATNIAPGLWHLPGPDTRSWLRAQDNVMEALRGLPARVFLAIRDDVAEEAEAGEWTTIAEGLWEIPPHESTGILLRGALEAGGWHVLVADTPPRAGDLPDLFKGDREAAVRTARDAGVHALIDAWHDNAEWRLLLPARTG